MLLQINVSNDDLVVAGVSETVAELLPGEVQQSGGTPRNLWTRPLMAGGGQQGEQVNEGCQSRKLWYFTRS